MSDKDRISPYNINTTSRRQVMRIEKNKTSIRGLLVDLILNYPNSFIRTVWQTAGGYQRDLGSVRVKTLQITNKES